ncbi:SCO1431 family membrane protein [Streptomyces sp. CA-111067]
MSDTAAHRTEAAPRTGTGGPRDRKQLLEHVLGWTLTVVVAMLIVQLHLM